MDGPVFRTRQEAQDWCIHIIMENAYRGGPPVRLLEEEVSFEEVRVIKVFSTNEFDRMMSALTHAPYLRNAHGKEQEGFDPLRPFGNAAVIEYTFRPTIGVWQPFEHLIRHKGIPHGICGDVDRQQPLDLVPT